MSTLTDVQERKRRREETLRSVAASPMFTRLLEVLNDDLENLRIQYENNPASEFNRGLVSQQRAIIKAFTNRG